MLAYLLALVVGLSSFGLYIAAFFFPEVHRKNDFIWSGLGLFYALVLWVCAGRITGGVLLGQAASVTLLSWLGWQMLTLRRQIAPVDQQTPLPTTVEWQKALSETLTNGWDGLSRSRSIAPFLKPFNKQVARLAAWLEALVSTATKPTVPPPVEPKPYVPLTPADFANAKRDAAQPPKIIATDAASVQAGDRSRPGGNPLTAIASSFKGMTAKRESKPVYVRKQFRAPETDPHSPKKPTTVADATEASSHNASESIPVEIVPPKLAVADPVAGEAAAAAIAEVETTTAPAIIVDAVPVPPTELSP